MPVSIEQHVDWIARLPRHLREQGVARIEATPEAEDGWVAHDDEVTAMTLLPRANSWWVGANIPGKPAASSRTSAGSGPTAASATRSPRRATRGSR